mgnify:CR=1 FL=1
MIYLIDNYDSFTYNIVEIFQKNNISIRVIKNDQLSLNEFIAQSDDIKAFILSPGPGSPLESGVSLDLLKEFYKTKPFLGVCLGHQIIAHFFGAQVIEAPQIMHGKISSIHHNQSSLYQDIPQNFKATRYHSLIVERESLPLELKESCWTTHNNGEPLDLMGFSHQSYPIHGIQFHPESIMTPFGEKILLNFVKQL